MISPLVATLRLLAVVTWTLVILPIYWPLSTMERKTATLLAQSF
jgi:hypothetical protein